MYEELNIREIDTFDLLLFFFITFDVSLGIRERRKK